MPKVRNFNSQKVVGAAQLDSVIRNATEDQRKAIRVLVKVKKAEIGEAVSVLGYRGVVETKVPNGYLVKIPIPAQKIKKNKKIRK